MKRVLLLAGVALAATACAGSETAPSSPTAAPSSTTTSSTAPTTTTPVADTSTSTTAVGATSTEAWGTWTLILDSIQTSAPGAEEQAQEIAGGLEGAAVLHSNDFPSLNPGYWVVYRGAFQSGTEASNWCADQPARFSCYPRYLGPDISPLAADDHALLIDGQALVVVDVATGERLKVFDPYFNGDGMGVGRMALTPDASALYYGVGFEAGWYACDSSRGQVWRLDLAFGTVTIVASGHTPAVSPDGRWMTVLLSEQCLPDPEAPDLWVLTPTDTVVLYNLTTGLPVEAGRWSVGLPPTSYEDPHMVVWVDWRADSQGLLMVNNAGNVFEVSLGGRAILDAGPPVVEGVNGYPLALVGDTLYISRDETPDEWGGFDLIAVDLATGAEGEVITRTVGWAQAAADTTRTRLIWGSDTRAGTAGSDFAVEDYVGGLAW